MLYRNDLDQLKRTFHIETPGQGTKKGTSTASAETKRRRLEKAYFKSLDIIHDFEEELGIEESWREGDANWMRVAEMSNTQNYRRCLDRLEQLVVSRMFELGKMNRSGTGKKIT